MSPLAATRVAVPSPFPLPATPPRAYKKPRHRAGVSDRWSRPRLGAYQQRQRWLRVARHQPVSLVVLDQGGFLVALAQ